MSSSEGTSQSNIYTPSGRSGYGWWLIPLIGLPAMLILSVVHGVLNVFLISRIYVCFLVFVAYMLGIHYVLRWVTYVSKCRSTLASFTTGSSCGLFALYAWWAMFVYVLIRMHAEEGVQVSLLDVFLSPGGIWRTAKALGAEGWFTILGMTPRGVVLWGMWVVEAMLVVLVAAVSASSVSAEEIFCEDCGRWCDETKLRFDFGDQPHLLTELSADNLAPLAELEPATAEAGDHVRLNIWQCSLCQNTAALQVQRVTVETDEKGESTEEAVDVTERIVVSPELIEIVQRINEMSEGPPTDD